MNLNELFDRVIQKDLVLPNDGKIDVTVGGINFIYYPTYVQISLQSPIVRNIPYTISPAVLLPLVEKLLAGAPFGSNMLGGGVAYKKETENTFQIVMNVPFKLKHVKNEYGLIDFVPKFKESIENWINSVQEHIHSAAYTCKA